MVCRLRIFEPGSLGQGRFEPKNKLTGDAEIWERKMVCSRASAGGRRRGFGRGRAAGELLLALEFHSPPQLSLGSPSVLRTFFVRFSRPRERGVHLTSPTSGPSPPRRHLLRRRNAATAEDLEHSRSSLALSGSHEQISTISFSSSARPLWFPAEPLKKQPSPFLSSCFQPKKRPSRSRSFFLSQFN